MTSFDIILIWMGVVAFVTGTTVVCTLLLAVYFRSNSRSNDIRSERRH